MVELLADATTEDIKAWVAIIGIPTAILVTIGILAEFYWARRKAWNEGMTLVGSLVQANTGLFGPKARDAPAMFLVSFESPDGAGLDELAERASALKGGPPGDAAEQAVARIVRNEEFVPWRRSLLPPEFTGGLKVYAVGVMVSVKLLPERRLTSRNVILKAIPGNRGRVFLAERQTTPTYKRNLLEDIA